MNVMYVVHPERRGVEGYAVPPNMAAPLYRHMVPQPVSLFHPKELTLGEELEHATVEVCRVEPGTVCPHGWFCTTDLRTAQFVDELRGERKAAVAYLRTVARRTLQHTVGYVLATVSDKVERGEHRKEETA